MTEIDPKNVDQSARDALEKNIVAIRGRIESACRHYGVPEKQIQLLAVSKTFPASAVHAAWNCGLFEFGENYVQEGVAKIQALGLLQQSDQARAIVWHFIGPLQSNKTKDIAEHFDWMHTVDREKIARRLSEQRPACKAPLQICIQVNISHQASKSGVLPNEVQALAQAIAQLPGLTLRGLMAIPEPSADFDQQRAPFDALSTLFTQTKAALPPAVRPDFNVLSMGMSADLEAAIAASRPDAQTMIRVGSAIFGQRNL